MVSTTHNYDNNQLGRHTAFHSTSQAFSDKGYRTSKSFLTHPSKCYSSYFFTTWLILSAPARFRLSSVVHSRRTRAMTSGIVVVSGTLFGAALPRFSHVHGWQFIRTCRVLKRGRRRIVFKSGYGTRFCRSSSIAFRCSYVRCSYPSTY